MIAERKNFTYNWNILVRPEFGDEMIIIKVKS